MQIASRSTHKNRYSGQAPQVEDAPDLFVEFWVENKGS
jgi:hypothetical protein